MQRWFTGRHPRGGWDAWPWLLGTDSLLIPGGLKAAMLGQTWKQAQRHRKYFSKGFQVIAVQLAEGFDPREEGSATRVGNVKKGEASIYWASQDTLIIPQTDTHRDTHAHTLTSQSSESQAFRARTSARCPNQAGRNPNEDLFIHHRRTRESFS